MFVVVHKLKRVKVALKKLHQEYFSGISQRVKNAQSTLSDIQSSLALDPFNSELIAKENEAVKQYKQMSSADISLVAQRAKITWLNEIDSNSAYFHANIK